MNAAVLGACFVGAWFAACSVVDDRSRPADATAAVPELAQQQSDAWLSMPAHGTRLSKRECREVFGVPELTRVVGVSEIREYGAIKGATSGWSPAPLGVTWYVVFDRDGEHGTVSAPRHWGAYFLKRKR